MADEKAEAPDLVPVRIRFNWDRYNAGEIPFFSAERAEQITTGKNPPGELVKLERDGKGAIVMDGNTPRVKGPKPADPKPGEAKASSPPKKEGVVSRMIGKGGRGGKGGKPNK